MDKASFVEELWQFYKNVVGNELEIVDMTYVTDGALEYVYVTFGAGSQKRFSVWGDNRQGILADFGKFIARYDDYPWLRQEEWQ